MNSSRPLTIMLVAIEPSADEIGALVLQALRRLAPGAIFCGCGGEAMARAGFESAFPTNQLSVMGAGDALRVLPLALRRARAIGRLAANKNADVAVFIDGWAFSRLAAVRLKKLSSSTTMIKLVAPQIWASRPERIEFVRDYFDGVLTLFPFEPPLFRRAGILAEFVGNPLYERAWTDRGDGAAFRTRHDLGQGPILAVLLGSRVTEIRRLADPFAAAVRLLCDRAPQLRLVVATPDNVRSLTTATMIDWPGNPIIVDPREKYDALAASTAALAASGTITTELAINRTPMVVAYRVDPLTAFWFKRLKTTPYASIINIAADRFIIPEFIQEKCRGALLANAVEPLLADPKKRRAQIDAFAPIVDSLLGGCKGSAERAAQLIFNWARLRQTPRDMTRFPSSALVF